MADPTTALNDGLRGQYAVDRPIGEGGMAMVYLAQDLKHQRPVALKVLKPELAQNLGPERFRREITTAARLQHPHILSVHDSGETAGHLWFTMPFVEGESLRDRLKRDGRLPVDDAIRIARETAQALQFAHERGIVHRDIKPENLLLTTDGSTLVADFGIARALGEAAEGSTNLTQTGTSIGTPVYMAPEQATGDRTVDARADQYALAATLYEMLAGEPPFTGTTAAALIAKRFSSAVPSVREKRPEVPAYVDAALQRALALRADDRYASIQEFSRAMASVPTPSGVQTVVVTSAETPALPAPGRRLGPALVAVGALALVGVIGALLLRGRPAGDPGAAGEAAAAATPGVTRLAVLPFENLGDSADAYFADGIADELRGKLTSIPGLEVIARGSSVQYKGTTKPQQAIAKELGVRYLLTGTVRWEKAAGGKGRVRVSPELIEVSAGGAPASKWQQAFDAPITDVFQVQSGIAEKVASALDVALGVGAQQTLAERPTQDLEAYDAFLRAEALFNRGGFPTVEQIRQAEQLYEEAVRRDPGFAKAWAQLARLNGLIYTNVSPRPTTAAKAREALARAMTLAPEDVTTVATQIGYERSVTKDYGRATRLLDEALKRWPDNPELLRSAAAMSQHRGDMAAARRNLEKVLQLDPRSVSALTSLTNVDLWARRLDEARADGERGWTLAPSVGDLQTRMMVELAAGDLPRARALIREGIQRFGRLPLVAEYSFYWDTYWALEPADLRYVASLRPDQGFDGQRATWALTLMQIHHLLGDAARTRAFADTARAELAEEMKETGEDSQRPALYGLVLAHLGVRDSALAFGERGVRLAESQGDFQNRQYIRHQLARIHLELGEEEQAIDILERLLQEPYYLSPGWLRIDPTLARLRDNPRFRKLAGL